MSGKATPTVLKIGQIQLRGNIIDDGWYHHIKNENGKTNQNAVLILSEIFYWYRPNEYKDEKTGILKEYQKKFKEDKLQKSYQAFGDKFGITKRQAKIACDLLVKLDLITVEFRTVIDKGVKMGNVMFIELNADRIRAISTMYDNEQVQDIQIDDEKDVKIAELEKKIRELEGKLEVKSDEDLPEEVQEEVHEDETQEELEENNEEDNGNLVVVNDGFKEVAIVYQQNIGMMPPIMIPLFSDYCDKLGKDLVIEAIKEAVFNNVRKPRYIEKILMSWEENGVTDLDKLQASRLERESEMNKGGKEGAGSHGSQGHGDKSRNKGSGDESQGNDEETLYDRFRKQRAEQDDT